MKQNPPWTEKAAKAFFTRMHGRTDVRQGLPRPRTALVIPHEVIPGRYHAMGKKKPPKFEEYGSGHYGTVMPTEEKGTVMKVTSDETEARFVKAALSIEMDRKGSWPDGMTHYIDIYRIGGSSHRGRGAYVLWREELMPHTFIPRFREGFTDYDRRAIAEGQREMKVYMALARNLFKYSQGLKGADILGRVQAHPDELQPIATEMYNKVRDLDISWPKLKQMFSMSQIRNGRLWLCAVLLLALEWQYDMMENTYATGQLGAALNFYLRHGIVLCDIHLSNIGHRVVDGVPLVPFVILDPGHSIFLTDAYNKIGVQEV